MKFSRGRVGTGLALVALAGMLLGAMPAAEAANCINVPETCILGSLTATDMRIRDADASDRIRFRADFSLGAASDGINPQAETVTIRLSTAAGIFYEKTVEGFTRTSRGWSLNDAERTRTGIERFDIKEDGTISFVDRATAIPAQPYPVIDLRIVVGDDDLRGVAPMTELPAGSGSWRLAP